jgi:hypothetical protein
VSRLSRQCGILNVSKPYRLPRTVTRIAFICYSYLQFRKPSVANLLISDYSVLTVRAITLPTASQNSDTIRVVILMVSGTAVLREEKYHWGWRQVQSVESVPARLRAHPPPLIGFHRAICPRCLLDRTALSQCQHLRHKLFKVRQPFTITRASWKIKTLWYKSEGRVFETPMRWMNIFSLPNSSSRTKPWALLSL